MNQQETALLKFHKWYTSLKKYSGNFPARGTISGALVILESLKADFNLDISSHTAKGGSQIKGASGEAIKRILSHFGEFRQFVSEGGRTNRGLRGDINNMLDITHELGLESITNSDRVEILEEMQKYLVERVKEYHNQQRIKFNYAQSKSTWQIVHDILTTAKETGKEGPVAQYFVGAKLQLRFPDIAIGNESFSTADDQLGRVGDFLVGNTAFHVTVSPMPAVFEKCLRNIEKGFRPFLIVSDRTVVGTKQNAEALAPGQIVVESIETFISQNIEELSRFLIDNQKHELRKLIETYNKRVNETEIDKSILMEIPTNL